MKIVFKKDVICNAVSPLMSGISTKNTSIASEGILIETVSANQCVLTTYDLEKGVRIAVEADVIEEGSAIINASKFSQTVRAMDGDDITLTVDAKMCATIMCGKSSHTMSALAGKDFPEIPKLTSQNGFTVAQDTLKRMIGKCMHAMGINDQRPILNGLYITIRDDEMNMVSCNSFQMALCGTHTPIEYISESGEGLNYKFIVPTKSVNELNKLISSKDEPVTIYMNRKNIIFVMGDVTFFSRLIEGEYLDYNLIIVKNHRISVYVDREYLLSALERAALITEEKISGSGRSHVRLEVVGDILKISATSNSGVGSSYDEVFVEHEGDDLAIAFNNRYLIDSLRASDAVRVKLSLSGARTSMNIEPADPETEENAGDSELFFLLPVRMKE